jgi:hypothetical protein
MLFDYWLAAYLGRVWLIVRSGLRLRLVNADMPGLCAALARGKVLSAESLWGAEDFAVRVWVRTGLVAVVLMGTVGMVAKALAHGAVAVPVISVVAVLICLSGVAFAQAGMSRYRSDRIRIYLRGAGASAYGQPLPQDAAGLPRRADFWVMLLIAVAVFGILFYSGTRSLHT